MKTADFKKAHEFHVSLESIREAITNVNAHNENDLPITVHPYLANVHYRGDGCRVRKERLLNMLRMEENDLVEELRQLGVE